MSGCRIRTYTVLPNLPERLRGLQRLAYNLWWCWNHEALFLFRRINEERFSSLENSPVKLIGAVNQGRFDELLKDDGFLAHLDRVLGELDQYLNAKTWFSEKHRAKAGELRIAYFSAEFGIHESIPIYSGGLGVLAGDHLKSASDLGLPLVGVGLMYRQGYMRQYLNPDGWQQERYPENDFFNLPLIPENDADGRPLMISVPFPDRDVHARIWRIQVGRVPLYLLDANVPENSPEDRAITCQLYGGDQEMRVKQEMILGIGGLRALHALGVPPTVCHMNEGHAAFMAIERIHRAMTEQKLNFDEAREQVTAGNVFTTHTPVPAGNDMFPPNLVDKYLSPYCERLGLNREEFLALGRKDSADQSEPFCMTILALRLANISNGVSSLHGMVSRKMWEAIWPGLPDAEIPITSITNGIHTPSWLSPEMAQLFGRYLAVHQDRHTDHTVWANINNVPDAELWRTHERRRERLIVLARQRLKLQLSKRGAPRSEIDRADEALDPDALTIGFARRFATYKRGDLIFHDIDRLIRLVTDKQWPVQFIFSGKAHPKDNGGKELIAKISHMSRKTELRRRIVFLEDYDMNLARYLVQGVDVWLNNPRRPLEASGTSGMKSAANGGLNMSILDGWWCEGYNHANGWAIGAGEEYTDLPYQDDVESRAIYELLEEEVVPLFYKRSSDGVPREWVRMMKNSLQSLCPVFNTNRMLEEYMENSYLPSGQRYSRLLKKDGNTARELARWRAGLQERWRHIRVEEVSGNTQDSLNVGRELEISARIHLGDVAPDDVEVQLFYGGLDSVGEIVAPQTALMAPAARSENGSILFRGAIPCRTSGQHGYAVRVLPRHKELANPFVPGLVCWG